MLKNELCVNYQQCLINIVLSKVSKLFNFKLLAGFFVILVILTANLANLKAKNDNIYLIENLYVNIEGKSPSDAKEKAFNYARKKAFLKLVDRLNVRAKFINLLEDEEISDLVRSQQIEGEKISGNFYSAQFKILFAKDFIEDLFLRKSASERQREDYSRPSFLIVPAKILEKKILLWESGNNFRSELKEEIKEQNVENFKIIEADIDNLAALNNENISKVGYEDLGYLFKKYGVNVIYLAFYSYDEIIKKVSVLVRGFERDRKFQYRLGFINSKNLNDGALVERVSGKIINYLSDLKFEEIKAQVDEKDKIVIQIPVRYLSDWLKISKRLKSSDFITEFEINSISRDYVEILISSKNSLEVVEDFATMGFELKKKSHNNYLMLY